jgi:hypothetical protein
MVRAQLSRLDVHDCIEVTKRRKKRFALIVAQIMSFVLEWFGKSSARAW